MTQVKSIVKASRILDLFSLDRVELDVNEIAQGVGMPKSTVARLANTLEGCNYLLKDPHNKRYRLSTKFLNYSNIVESGLVVLDVAQPLMESIHEESGETVFLNVIEKDERICIKCIESNHTLKSVVFVGKKCPLYAGASSKTLLAHLTGDRINKYLNRVKMKMLTPNTPTDKAELINQLISIKKEGYASSNGEVYTGACATSAPIFNHKREILASLSLGYPSVRAGEDRVSYFIQLVKSGAEEVSARLGYVKG